jgi:hypothetical protein
MNKVYIVTSGTYSDYAIEEVFDNREDAERYICLHDNDSYLDMRVEEYDIYKNAELKNVKVHYGIYFIMRENGINFFDIVYDNKPIETNINRFKHNYSKSYDGTLPLSNRNIFKDKDVVKKIVYDAVAKFKAEEAGIC